MKKWKCAVCGYIHDGQEPPEKCPVCGADKSKFIEITEEEPAGGPEAKSASAPKALAPSGTSGLFQTVSEKMAELHAHPISVHIPNGVLPVGVIFLMLALFFGLPSLELASFYNLIAVVLAMPFVMFFGYVDWKNRFKGRMTRLFMSKIVCGVFVTIVGLLLVIWRIIDPEVAAPESANRLVYLLVHLSMLGAAVFAGYLGGKLVFKK